LVVDINIGFIYFIMLQRTLSIQDVQTLLIQEESLFGDTRDSKFDQVLDKYHVTTTYFQFQNKRPVFMESIKIWIIISKKT
jgi:hypothetical protein